MEIWKTVPSLPEYDVSSYGRVRKKIKKGNMPNGGERKYGGHVWRGVWNKQDNRYILQFNGKTYKVARLICEAFHGPPTKETPVCMHLNEDPRDNRPNNLKWGTQKENLNAPGFIEYCKNRKGENNPRVKGMKK